MKDATIEQWVEIEFKSLWSGEAMLEKSRRENQTIQETNLYSNGTFISNATDKNQSKEVVNICEIFLSVALINWYNFFIL